MKKWPVHSRAGRVRIAWAASATIPGLRERRIMAGPPRANSTAAVAMVVRGQSALQAMPAARNSSAIPSMHSDIPYFDNEKGGGGANRRGLRSGGGNSVNRGGLGARLK